MNNKYNDMFDSLVQSYYNGDFDKTLNNIITCHEVSPQETFKIICSLCGVSLEFDNNYVYNLKKAITNYSVDKNLIQKLESCTINCPQDTEKKFKCQNICPFNAIYYNDKEKATFIDPIKCLDCGLCIDACKDGRILDKIEFIPVADMLKNNEIVYAIVAPSIIGQFGDEVSMDMLRAAFIRLGFTDMIEVAFAADILSIKEAMEFNHLVNSDKDFMISSCCCPMWVGMLKKVYKDLIPNLSPSVSPMIAAGRVLKKLNNNAKVVFIGPCIAKKAEIKEKGIDDAVDFVLTYQELENIFRALKINPATLAPIPTKEYVSSGGISYASTGGVSSAIKDCVNELYPDKSKYFKAIQGNGVKECKALLENALNGTLNGNFIEGMGCVGGCVGGPKVIVPPSKGKAFVEKQAQNSPIKVPLYSETLNNILSKVDINSIEDFNNKDKIDFLERKFY